MVAGRATSDWGIHEKKKKKERNYYDKAKSFLTYMHDKKASLSI